MTAQNIQYKVLVQFTDELTKLIQHNAVSLSTKLYAVGLVPEAVHVSISCVDGTSDQSKAAKLLSCVRDKVRKSPGRFDDFIEALGQDVYFEDLVMKMKEALNGKGHSK